MYPQRAERGFIGSSITSLVGFGGPVGEQEGSYLSLLRPASSYERTADGMLNLKGADGTRILV